MSGGVSTLLKIPRSANNPRSKTKSEKSDESILEDPTIFESEYTYYFSRVDNPAWINLTVFSIFTFFNSSISERPYWTAYIIFSNYFFFWFYNRSNFFIVRCISFSKRIYCIINLLVVFLLYLKYRYTI